MTILNKIKIFLFLTFFLLPAFSASAATVSPLKLEAEINPGETASYSLTLFNETDKDVFLTSKVEVFKPKSNGYQAEITPSFGSAYLSWLTLPQDSLILKPGEKKTVPVLISIPKTANVGGYYLAIMWESKEPSANKANLGVSSRIGVLVFLRVNGEVTEKMSSSGLEPLKRSVAYFNFPISFRTDLKNEGNVHLKPKGLLVIKNIFGQVVDTVPFNPDGGIILPSSEKEFLISWDREDRGFFNQLISQIKYFSWLRLSAVLELDYGESHQRLSSAPYGFFVWPIELSVIFLAVAFLLLFNLIFNRRSKKVNSDDKK